MSNKVVEFPMTEPERDVLRQRKHLRDAVREFATILTELQLALATLAEEAGEDT